MMSMISVLIQLDQHDYAVKNRHTLGEHRYPLDVPSWAGTLRLSGIRAFDRAWDAYLEDGQVRVEPA